MPGDAIQGDYRMLDDLERALAAAPELLEPMSKQMAEEALDKIAEGWRKQSDPYDEPWKPKLRDDGRSILVGKTTRLRGGWKRKRADRYGWVVGPSVKYAGAHQNPQVRPNWGKRPGKLKKLPRRRMIPTRERGLPASWKAAFRDVATDTLAAHFAKVRAHGGSFGGGRSALSSKIAGLNRRLTPQAIARRVFRALNES